MMPRSSRFPSNLTTMMVAILGLALPGRAFARGKALEAITLGGDKVRIDGVLKEWPARLDPLDTVVKGSPSGGEPSASGGIGYDDQNLYVAMKIRDAKLVRTAAFGDGEDHATLELAFPSGRTFRSRVVDLFAGVIGKSAGTVKLDGAQVRGARLVEAPQDGGYVFEASIPWAAFPEATRTRAGLRAALRYTDAVASGSVKAVIATGGGQGQSMAPLLLEAEQGLYRDLLKAKGISETPDRFASGDLTGDAADEILAVYGPYLTVLGSGYRGGKEFFFQDLDLGESGKITRFDVQDMTGDGKVELVLGKRIGTKDAYREIVQILRTENGDAPYVAFQHETAIVTKDGEIRNEVSLKKKGAKVDLVIEQGKVTGFDPATYAEPLPGDMDSALLPWQTMKSVTYEWDGKQFAPAGSQSWTPTMKAPTGRPVVKSEKAARSDEPPEPPPPRPPSPEEMLERVYALYRQDRKVGAERPRFDFATDVVGDRGTERVLIHGKDIVVFGKGYKQGTSYAFITIGVESPKDIADVTARDLTGDGKAEILVRCVLHAKASKQMGGDVVDRHGFFVYQVTESGIRRVFAAETGRSLGKDSVMASIRFVPKGRGTQLELSPGRAVGWSAKTYPFPVDKAPYGGLEPLLVPWGDVAVKRYHFDGSAYVE